MSLLNFAPTARRDPLGPSRLNGHLESLNWMRRVVSQQHHPAAGSFASVGEHNAWETARVSRRITFGGGTATLGNASTDITAVGNPATGTLTLTLAASRFTTGMRLQVTAEASDGTKPRIASWRVISATSVEVYLKELSSALGAGNVWAVVNGAVSVAIHDAPLAAAAWPLGPTSVRFPNSVVRGDFLVKQSTEASSTARGFWWDDYAYHHATLRDAYLREHTTAGEHNSINIARRTLQASWKSAGTFTKYAEAGDTFTLTDVSTGIVQLDYTAVTTAQSHYICPDWTRDAPTVTVPGTPVVVNPLPNTTSRTTLYGFAHNVVANTWSRARFDFWLSLHSA